MGSFGWVVVMFSESSLTRIYGAGTLKGRLGVKDSVRGPRKVVRDQREGLGGKSGGKGSAPEAADTCAVQAGPGVRSGDEGASWLLQR